MVALADAVFVLFPNAAPLVDYVVSDAGSGPFISHWNEALGPQPTAEQLAAVTEQQVIDARGARNPEKRDLHAMATAHIADLDTIIGAGSFTNAQRDAAIKKLAQGQKAIVKRLVQLQ